PSRGRVVLDRVLHRERFRELVAEARSKPLLVVLDRTVILVLRLDEVLDDLDYEIGGETLEIDLRWMLDPVSLPVVVDRGGDRFVGVVDSVRQQLGDALVLRERDVRAFVESVFLLVDVRSGVTSEKITLFEHQRFGALFLEAVCGAIAGHAGADDTDLAHVNTSALGGFRNHQSMVCRRPVFSSTCCCQPSSDTRRWLLPTTNGWSLARAGIAPSRISSPFPISSPMGSRTSLSAMACPDATLTGPSTGLSSSCT